MHECLIFYVEESIFPVFLGVNLFYLMLFMKFSKLTELFIYNVESNVLCLLTFYVLLSIQLPRLFILFLLISFSLLVEAYSYTQGIELQAKYAFIVLLRSLFCPIFLNPFSSFSSIWGLSKLIEKIGLASNSFNFCLYSNDQFIIFLSAFTFLTRIFRFRQKLVRSLVVLDYKLLSYQGCSCSQVLNLSLLSFIQWFSLWETEQWCSSSQVCFQLSSWRALEASFYQVLFLKKRSLSELFLMERIEKAQPLILLKEENTQSQLCLLLINIIMFNVFAIPLEDLPAGRPLFKKGEFYKNFYYLEEGKVNISINQVFIEISTPMFIGDYELLSGIQYRTTMIKTITKCRIRVIPIQQYEKIDHYHQKLRTALKKYQIRNKVLHYWLLKLFSIVHCKRSEEIRYDKSIGVILQGQFKIDSHIPIVKMREKNLQLRRKFEISLLGELQLFEDNVICQSHKGLVGVMIGVYVEQLQSNFEQFSQIIDMSDFKRKVHLNMTRDIARNCRKKASLFEQMVPITLKHSIQIQPDDSIGDSSLKKQARQPSRSINHEDVYSIQNNISQFLHQQWRRGLSLKLPKKERGFLKLQKINSTRQKSRYNPQRVSIAVPTEFRDIKFNYKMMLKTKDHHMMVSRRIRTEPTEAGSPKLLFDK